MSKAELTLLRTEVEQQLQFVVNLSIFLPGLIYVFMITSGNTDRDASKIEVGWASGAGLYLLSYTLYQYGKYVRGVASLKRLHRLITLAVILYALSIGTMATINNAQFVGRLAFMGTTIGIVALPGILFLYLLVDAIQMYVKKYTP
jgi:hypothetical protein